MDKDKNKRISEKGRIQYIGTVLFTLLALALIVYYSFGSFYSITKEDIVTIGENSLAKESERLNTFLLHGLDVLQVTGFTVDYMLKENHSSEEIEKFLLEESEVYKNNIDKGFTGIYGLFNGVYIDGIGWVPDEDYNPKERPWYTAALEGKGKPVIVSPYLDAQTGSIMFSVSQLLSDGESVVSLDVVMDEMQKFAEDINLNGNGYGMIVDKNGLVVAHTDSNQKGKNYLQENNDFKYMTEKVYNSGGKPFEMNFGEDGCIVFSKNVQNDWYVIMVVNQSDLFSKVQRNLIRNIFLSLLIFAAMGYFCTTSYRNRKKATHYAEELKDYQITLEDRIKEQTKEISHEKENIQKLFLEVIQALANTIDAKDKYTNGHSVRVAEYSKMLAEKMNLSKTEQENIYYIALLHDIGKIGVPDDIINKNGKLTTGEFEIIKQHPVKGSEILELITLMPEIIIGARWHHERYDGKGYPDQLQKEEIPLAARIISVADSYDAMTSKRSYRDILPQEVVKSEIENGMGTQFDPNIAEKMIELINDDKDYNMHE